LPNDFAFSRVQHSLNMCDLSQN